MTSPPMSSRSRIPGGPRAILLFVAALSAFVVQSELAQYVQSTRHYRRPFLLLYLSHSSFTLLLPLHLAILRISSAEPLEPTLLKLKDVARQQIDELPFKGRDGDGKGWPWQRGVVAILLLTLGVTCPAGLWYISVPLTSMTSITVLFNTSALFAYLLSVAFLGEAWAALKLTAVGLATGGVAVIAYGSAGDTGEGEDKKTHMLLGDMLSLAGAAAYGLYEVFYKKFFSLDHPHRPASAVDSQPKPKLPFALYPNFITSLLGIGNIVLLFPLFFILHFSSLEIFETPWSFAKGRPDEGSPAGLTLAVCLCASLGVVYNGAFMILLSLWGPVVASVGNLLTIILIAVTDSILSSFSKTATSPILLTTIVGGILVGSSFAVLVWDMMRAPSSKEEDEREEYVPLGEEEEIREELLDEESELGKRREPEEGGVR